MSEQIEKKNQVQKCTLTEENIAVWTGHIIDQKSSILQKKPLTRMKWSYEMLSMQIQFKDRNSINHSFWYVISKKYSHSKTVVGQNVDGQNVDRHNVEQTKCRQTHFIFRYEVETKTFIKWQVIQSDRKFSQLFNGIICHFVSVGEKFYSWKYNIK